MRLAAFLAAITGLVALWLLPARALAQYGPGELAALTENPVGQTISGEGSASVKRAPATLRMHIELLGKGKTLQEALEKLKERRQAAAAQLKALKADPASIEFGDPTLSNSESQQRRQFEAMVIERYNARGRELPEGLKVPKSFAVSVSLTAEWPLEAGDPEDMLLAVQTLRDQVKAADLAGTKDAEELSPEEEELAEEMSQTTSFSGQEEIKPGEPYFLYVAQITDQERDKAFADAFAKAKQQASRLAQAAGAKLGPLVALSGGGGGGTELGDDSYGYEFQRYMRRLRGAQGIPGELGEENEAVASAPGSLAFTFYVKAAFRLEQ